MSSFRTCGASDKEAAEGAEDAENRSEGAEELPEDAEVRRSLAHRREQVAAVRIALRHSPLLRHHRRP